MRHLRYLLFWILSLFVLGLYGHSQAFVQVDYRYAYAVTDSAGKVTIKTVDLADPTHASDLLSETADSHFRLLEISASPNGEWIAFVFSDNSENMIRLVNVFTQAQTDLRGFLLSGTTGGHTDTNNLISWSWDSQKLAFNALQPNGAADTYLFLTNSGTIQNLTKDAAQQYQFEWLYGLEILSVVSTDCSSACQSTIDFFNTFSFLRQGSIDITGVIQNSGASAGGTVCQLESSPGGQYISFMTTCDPTETNAFKELYVADIPQHLVFPITSLTSQVNTTDPFAPIFADYDSVWYDHYSLLVGAIFSNANSQGTQISIHHAPDFGSVILGSEMAQEWVINPGRRKLAFRSISISPPGLAPQNVSIKIVALSDSSLRIFSTHPAGCNLSWSPDGTTLAYTDTGSPFVDCDRLIQKLHFTNITTGQTTTHSILSGETSSVASILPVGWIGVQGPIPILSPSSITSDQTQWITGGQIVYTVDTETGLALAWYDISTRSERLITDGQFTDWDPELSPLGDQIAFVSDRDGDESIYVIYTDGSGLRRLSPDPSDDSDPTWSPDGSRIAYVTRTGSSRNVEPRIWLVNADGTNNIELNLGDEGGTDPAWSPNGQQLAFSSWRGGGDNHLFVINVDGTGLRQLTFGSDLAFSPKWSPDGTKIAFHSEGINYIDALAGGNVQQITAIPEATFKGWVSNDTILYSQPGLGGYYYAFTIRIDGTELTDLNFQLPQGGSGFNLSSVVVVNTFPLTATATLTPP